MILKAFPVTLDRLERLNPLQHRSAIQVPCPHCPRLPGVCRHLRDLFATDAAEYMMSLTGSDALRELSSPGKSGSVFYLSHDDRFLIKTMRKTEMHTLLNMLPAYYRHVRTYDNTLLTKFYGLHRIKPAQGRKVGTKQGSGLILGHQQTLGPQYVLGIA